MIELSRECRLVFCIGAGGVGKTTFSAALGIDEATRGRKVLVLTADPARRLADTFGVNTLHDADVPVALSNDALGTLHAAMLETKSTADHSIERVATDPTHAKRVLENRVYKAFSQTLSRSHAYAAMERIHEAVHNDCYDLVIVDTPPAQSALEVLDAPLRLTSFLKHRTVQWFTHHEVRSTHHHGGMLGRRLLRMIIGHSLVGALTEFLSEMAFLSNGFLAHARQLSMIMRSSQTSLILVGGSGASEVKTSRKVVTTIRKTGLIVHHVVFNHAFIVGLTGDDEPDAKPLPELQAMTDKVTAIRTSLAMEQVHKQLNILAFYEGIEEPPLGWTLPESIHPLARRDDLLNWIRLGKPMQSPQNA